MSSREGAAKSAGRFIVIMGFVALFGDLTYEGARSLVGPYLLLLGASAATVGFVAGAGEFLGYGLRIASGMLADRSRRYWLFVFLGYGVNLLAVPGLALAGNWEAAIALILLERLGKAIRSPARTTLVSYAARQHGTGKSFGLDEALDQLGAIAGPLLTAGVIWTYQDAGTMTGYRIAFVVLLFPVLANLLLLVKARWNFPDPSAFEPETPAGFALDHGNKFKKYIVASCFVAFGFADWSLISYHAVRVDLFEPALIPVIYAAVMGADALAAICFGVLFDRRGMPVLVLAVLLSAPATLLVFLWPVPLAFLSAAVLWGFGMGAQESIFKAVIAEMVRPEQRSRAYGIFFAAFGLAWWAGSATMGLLYSESFMAVAFVSFSAQLVGCFLLFRLSGLASGTPPHAAGTTPGDH